MNNEELQQLKALAMAATPGPWEATRQSDDECNHIGYFIEAGDKAISDDGTAPSNADALFIAAANPSAIIALIDRIESLAAPAVANGAAELPPLPEPAIEGSVMHQELKICYLAPVHFTADQMQAYARAAIAASAQQTAPKPLTKAQSHALATCVNGGTQMGWISDDDARAILTAASPNALLVAALKEIIKNDPFNTHNSSIIARAALASVPAAQEAT